ncbi:nuclear protein [Psittacid alphaherpesvirus 5]|uniref:Nuclear protein n=1 Tax=Psittacid alphaherpesvirus 5 TaxID=2972693 RepID=A0A5P9JS04_9ALPH|nr:nuclear protein [Psittacid alphaherpesvirus 5]QFU14598.1 nuclear protein [Psittacid alphaherpesvirus 5]UOO01069.1 nuclear protein [Psittacid alphaherpesvirus 5]
MLAISYMLFGIDCVGRGVADDYEQLMLSCQGGIRFLCVEGQLFRHVLFGGKMVVVHNAVSTTITIDFGLEDFCVYCFERQTHSLGHSGEILAFHFSTCWFADRTGEQVRWGNGSATMMMFDKIGHLTVTIYDNFLSCDLSIASTPSSRCDDTTYTTGRSEADDLVSVAIREARLFDLPPE